ncbi:MAG: hypothetical protein KQH59_01935 [Desulfobulbaceae bacterium]|nr:hypothetical protein [Desulfobulbaceae bacterium]
MDYKERQKIVWLFLDYLFTHGYVNIQELSNDLPLETLKSTDDKLDCIANHLGLHSILDEIGIKKQNVNEYKWIR